MDYGVMGKGTAKEPPLVRELFLEALGLSTAAEQAALLDRVPDRAVRVKVEALLGSYRTHGLFEEPAVVRPPGNVSSASYACGTVIGRYKLLEQIGEGGFGVVYLAEQEEPVRRQVALKIIKLGLDTKQVIARFEAERQALAMMDHPHIAKVLDAGATETGRPFFVMELVRGVPITKFCEENRCSIHDRLELFIPVCHAIQHAHQKGIIHRDIKPSNVLVTENEGVPHPLVIDFGVAKAIDRRQTEKAYFTQFAQMIGTPAYMSPEQAEMGPASVRDVDTRTDVYALGILLYELLTGSTPFPEERLRKAGYAEVQRIIGQEEPVQPSTLISRMNGKLRPIAANRRCEPAALVKSIKGDLDWIVLKAIDKDRDRRYATPNELAEDIRRCLNDEPILARPLGSTERLRRWCRRNSAVAALSAGLVLALVAGLVGTLWQLQRARQNAAENLRQVARLHVLNGVNLLQEGDYFKSLLWFAEALTLKAEPPERTAVDRLRIAAIVAMGPQLATVITHDGQPVADAAFHPANDQLATVGRDRRLRVWVVPSGDLIFMTKPFDEPPSHVQFSPDGERLLVVSSEFNHAWLLSATNGEILAGPISHLAVGAHNRPLPPRFDQAGKLLLTQSAPDTLQVWSTHDASQFGSPVALDAPVVWMNFSADGHKILVRTEDGRVLTADWQTGNVIEFSKAPQPSSQTLSHTLSNSSAATDKGDVEGFDEGRMTAESLPHDLPGAAFDRDHKLLLTFGRDRSARLWDATMGTALLPPIEHLSQVRSAVFSPDAARFATITYGGRMRVWSTDTGEPLTPPLDHTVASGPVEFSSSGRFMFAIHPAHAVYIWDLLQTNQPPVLLRPGSPRTLAESSQDGSVIMMRDSNSPIRVRALAGAADVSLHPSSQKMIPIQAWFDATSQFIILEYPKQRAQIWHAATGLPVTPSFQSRYASNEAEYRTVTLAAFSLVPTEGSGRSEAPIAKSPIPNPQSETQPLRVPPSDLRVLGELLSGSRLDGTGGWRPLELSEIVARWSQLALDGPDRVGSNSVRELTVGAQSRTQSQPGSSIHVQHSGGDTPDHRPSNNHRAIKPEVLFPRLGARVEQTDNRAGVQVNAGQITPLIGVASVTGEREVGEVVGAAVFSRNDVFNVEGGEWQLVLVQPTVLAASSRPFPNLPASHRVHQVVADALRTALALAWRIPTRSSASTYARYSSPSAGVRDPSADFSASSPKRRCVARSACILAIRRATSGVKHWVRGSSTRSSTELCLSSSSMRRS